MVRHVVSQDVWGVRIGAIGDERVVLAPIASADSNPQVPYGTNPQVPDLGYYESNSGIHSAGDTTRGSMDLPF